MKDALKRIRLERGLKKKEVSEGSGISYQAYSNYEYGLRKPGLDVLAKLAAFYGCTIEELIGIKKDPPEEDESFASGEVVYQFLIDAGYIQDGDDLSDSDLRFLETVLDLLSEWFNDVR